MRPDRIIEKRAKWQDYLDPEEDPGLLEEGDLEEMDELDHESEDEAPVSPADGSSPSDRKDKAPGSARVKPKDRNSR